MRTDWLDDILALLDAGSVVGAAAARNISQSAFSRRVQALEAMLGIELIDRSSKPNRASEALQKHSEKIRAHAHQQHMLIKEIQAEARTGSTLIVIAAQHAISTSLGPEIVKGVTRTGNVHVRLRSANLDECETLLMTRQAQLALTYRIENESERVRNSLVEDAVIASETLVPVYATPDVETMLERFHDGDLDVVGYPSDVFLGSVIARRILPKLERKCRITITTETALTPAALQFAAASMGVAWVPEALARIQLRDGSLTELGDDLGRVEMQIVARRLRERDTHSRDAIWRSLTDRHR
ncbi:MAG: LysR family transcriptional regulator [Pseudomonadota bacterium]